MATAFSKNTLSISYCIDWQTPDKYIAAAYDVMGEIDLDPMSSDRANARIKAKKYFTHDTNGLKQPWSGRIWLNPAYDFLPEAVEKLIGHYQRGDFEQAILFTHTLTTWEAWFQDALAFAEAFCFINELVEWYPGHKPELGKIAEEFGINPVYDVRGTIAAYYGSSTYKFEEIFKDFGVIR